MCIRRGLYGVVVAVVVEFVLLLRQELADVAGQS